MNNKNSNNIFQHNEFSIQKELWLILKNHYNDTDQSQADSAFAEINQVCEKYGNSQFAIEIGVAVFNQLQLRWMELHKG